MKTIEEREQEGYTSITDLRRVLSGLKNRKDSKVYLKVNQREGYNYLDVYVETNLPEESPYHGINHLYQYKMNQIGK